MRDYIALIEQLSDVAVEKTAQRIGDRLEDAFEKMAERDYTSPLMKQIETFSRGKGTACGFIDWVSHCDPTKNSQYTAWLLARIIKGDFRYFEDIIKAYEVLLRFDVLKPHLSVDQRDIGRMTWVQLNDLIEAHAGVETESERAKARTEYAEMVRCFQIAIILDNDKYRIAIPKTEAAACLLGQNTRWCTAARENNMFSNYSKDLIVILDKKNNQRWQFHFASNQFMDEKDEPIDTFAFGEQYPEVVAALRGYMDAAGLIRFGLGTPNMSFSGNLNLGYCTGLTALPEGLSVSGDLNLRDCTGLTALPEGLAIGGYLNLDGCTSLTALPEGLSVSGSLSLWRCTGLTALPKGLSVGRNLNLRNCTGLTALPEGFSVGGNFYLGGCTGLKHINSHPGVRGAIFR